MEQLQMEYRSIFDKFCDGEIMLNTPTKELYKKLLQVCEEKGMDWQYSRRPTEIDMYDTYGSKTCIDFFTCELSIDGIWPFDNSWVVVTDDMLEAFKEFSLKDPAIVNQKAMLRNFADEFFSRKD